MNIARPFLPVLCVLLFLNLPASATSSRELQDVLQKGEQLLKDGKATEAIETFTEGLEMSKKLNRDRFVALMYLGLARAFALRDDPKMAEENAKLALQANPNLAQAYSFLGKLYLDSERFEESLQSAFRSLHLREEKGQSAESEVGLIVSAYESLGNYTLAEEQIRNMIASASEKKNARGTIVGYSLLAELQLKQSKHNLAIETFLKLLPLTETLPELQAASLRSDAFAGLGQVYRKLGGYEQALDYFEKSLTEAGKISQSETSQRKIVRGLKGQADVYQDQGNFKQASEIYTKAYQIASTSNLTTNQMQLLPDLIQSYRGVGAFEKEEEYWNVFLKIGTDLKGEKEKAVYSRVAASIYEIRGEYQKALELDRQMLQQVEEKTRPLLTADCLQSVAKDLFKLGKYEEALEYLERALKIRNKLSHFSGVAYCLHRIGDIKEAQGKVKTARSLYHKARAAYEKIEQKDSVAGVLVDLGGLELSLGNLIQASEYYTQAQKIFGELGNRLEEAAQWTNLAQISEAEGELYGLQGLESEAKTKHEEALKLNEQALKIKRELGATLRTIPNLTSIGRQYMFLQEYEKGEASLKEALELATRFSRKRQETSIQTSLAELYYRKQIYPEAERILIQIIERTPEKKRVYWKVWYYLGLVQQETDRRSDAIDSIEKAIKSIEILRRATTGSSEERSFLNRYREVYQAMIELLLGAGHLEKAYYYIEKEKLAEFSENHSEENPSFGNKEKDNAYQKAKGYQFSEIRIQDEIEEERNREHPDEEVIRNLKSLLGAIDKEFADYLTELKLKFPDVVEQLQGDPRSLRSMKASIPEGVLVIQPVVLPKDKKISILVYSRTVTFVRETKIQDVEAFQEVIGHFLDVLRNNGKQDETHESAAQLYRWLIRPIEKEVRKARLLVVSASGRLRKVPFQALYNEQEKQYLVETIPVVNLALLKQLDVPQHSQAELKIFAMANPDPSDPQLALPRAEEQVKNIQKTFPDMRTYLHGEAIVEKLRWKENDNSYNVLLFATHALLDDESPANSHILLAKGQKLTYENIPQFSPFWPHVQMVVLSACDTAVAPTSENSAIDSLAENFDLIGIRSIVASLWQVNDDSTSILMIKFFENLKGGSSLADALQKAQLGLLNDSRYSHPYHWAPFVLIGDWR